MKQIYTGVIHRDGEWWLGWVKEIRGVNAQERTREELLESLRCALGDMLELNKADALDSASVGYEEVKIEVCDGGVCWRTFARKVAHSCVKGADIRYGSILQTTLR